MSRRKQSRPQHFATSDEEELDESSNKPECGEAQESNKKSTSFTDYVQSADSPVSSNTDTTSSSTTSQTAAINHSPEKQGENCDDSDPVLKDCSPIDKSNFPEAKRTKRNKSEAEETTNESALEAAKTEEAEEFKSIATESNEQNSNTTTTNGNKITNNKLNEIDTNGCLLVQTPIQVKDAEKNSDSQSLIIKEVEAASATIDDEPIEKSTSQKQNGFNKANDEDDEEDDEDDYENLKIVYKKRLAQAAVASAAASKESAESSVQPSVLSAAPFQSAQSPVASSVVASSSVINSTSPTNPINTVNTVNTNHHNANNVKLRDGQSSPSLSSSPSHPLSNSSVASNSVPPAGTIASDSNNNSNNRNLHPLTDSKNESKLENGHDRSMVNQPSVPASLRTHPLIGDISEKILASKIRQQQIEEIEILKSMAGNEYLDLLKGNPILNSSILNTMNSGSAASHSLSTVTSPGSASTLCSPSHVNLKNRCDKCDGTYATLAALISHKKSCKAVQNLTKRSSTDYNRSSSSSRIKLNFEPSKKGMDYGSNVNDDIVRRKGPAQLSSNSINDGPVHNAIPQWPNEFMVPPFPIPGPDALSESLAQFIASANAEHIDSNSPASDEHNAALFTQQMMFFHMLQQLQGASQIPPLPLLAAAAAAAAQQQQHHPSLSSDRHDSEDIDPRNFNRSDTKESIDHISRLSHSRTSAPVLNSFAHETTKTSKCQSDEKELDEPKRPSSAASSSTSVSTSQPSNTQKLISSLLDLKDTNPDVPLPPMMSPPKNDSSNSATFNEPNTLELLQKHTEQALQNTMSGGSFLLNGLSPTDSGDLLNFRKGKDGKEDPSCRHRCKFCGKVFGSDSALQIHIRSHTGERPFKCNICGNRFTTKGNLKVHFQRHKAKYPHVKMNPHPVPEHLDKFHPPLEPPSNSQSPPPPPSGMFSSSPTSSFNNTNTLHIPAIFSSTLIPYGSESSPTKETPKSSADHSKPKTRSFFDFSNLYKGNSDSKALSLSTAVLSNRIDNLADQSKADSDCDESKEKFDLTDSEDSDTDLECNYDNLRKRVLESENMKDDEPNSGDDDNDDDNHNDDNHNENNCKDSKISEDVEISEKFETNKPNSGSYKDENEDNDLDVDSDEEIFGDHPDQSDGINMDKKDNKNHVEIDDSQSLSDYDDTSVAFPFHAHLPYFASLSGSSAGIMPPSFGFMGLPFGANSTNLPTSLTTPPNSDQPFSRNENNSELPESAASKDPTLYQNLLPKPGSTDNTWETLMEVQKASETVKLQQLVDNIEHKMNDPNQCIICERVLSCKSALQMHYRTHTGERPFKCKICSRAFTTKGNLKTHMGVHRVKPPLRMLHQCPICHKQFTNALVLQQHLRLHAGEQGSAHSADIAQEMLAKFKNNPFLSPNFPQAFLPPGFGGPFPMPAGFPPSLMPEMPVPNLPNSNPMAQFPASLSKDSADLIKTKNNIGNRSVEDIDNDIDDDIDDEIDEDDLDANPGDDIEEDGENSRDGEIELEANDDINNEEKEDIDEEVVCKVEPRLDGDTREEISVTQENNELSNDKKRKLTQVVKEKTVTDDANSTSDTTEIEDEQDLSPSKRKKPTENVEPEKVKEESALSTLSALENHVLKATSQLGSQQNPLFLSTPNITPEKGNVLDLTPRSNSDSLSSKSSSSPAIDSRMYSPSAPFAGLPYHPTGRPNTTCRICLKTFACYSALEIHYRSHTKERPFKCEVCDRGFSTKGNMKQHMLTHKIRDLPPDLYTTVSPSSNTTLGNFLTSSHISKLMGKHFPENDSTNNSNTSSRVSSPPTPNGNNSNSVDSTDNKLRNCESPNGDQSSASSRTSGSNKHMCTLCNKPFSSGSALQIHMRTHTGDKPFKCTICGRAFTTKGNLKVHMGTHMWNNNPSRRGRRMSIDLPSLHLTPSNILPAKQQHQPPPPPQQQATLPPPPHDLVPNQTNQNHDLFFPYLPPHFLNGSDANQLAMQQMMLMKMMQQSGHHQQQQQQLQHLSIGSDKRTIASSNEDSDNDDADNGVKSKHQELLLRESKINLARAAKKRRQYFETNSPNTNDDIDEDDDEEEENKSYKSDIQNNSNQWLAKQWKMPCTICRHLFTSPVDFEEHIKAHLHAAVSSASPASDGKSTASAGASLAKTAGILS